ncbi:putative methylesterase 11 [Abeliophyllum distichum]|uniref:Methylesterase 11 n=1 Tax=Abeliophyllum distichum TaxID=126358 RepID=A0ABD1TF53_9LAMI
MGLCFSRDNKSTAKKRPPLKRTTNHSATASGARVGGGGSTRIRSSRKEENLIHEQALAAAILYQQQLQNGGAAPFDRSTSLRYPSGNSKKNLGVESELELPDSPDSGNSNRPTPSSSSISSSELLLAESPSPSVSDGAIQLDGEITEIPMDNAFLDQLLTIGPENTIPDFGIFPGFDEFSADFLTAPLPSVDYWPENTDNIFSQDSFLWSF